MNARSIIGLVQTGAQLASQVAELVDTTRDTLNSDDRAAIEAALANMQASNNRIHGRLQALLRQAAAAG